MFDKMTIMRLQHNVNSTPSNSLYLLWQEVWETCRRKLNISLHNHLPEVRIQEVDDLTINLLNDLGVKTERQYKDKTYRYFLMKGIRVYFSNQQGCWKQD